MDSFLDMRPVIFSLLGLKVGCYPMCLGIAGIGFIYVWVGALMVSCVPNFPKK